MKNIDIRRTRPAGFTLLELMVVIVILIIISSLVIPALAKARFESRKTQCTNNLKQLGSALLMYQSFEGRTMNAFPERLTHMADPQHQYVNDDRIFVCPMDYTHATGNTLKPGNPSDNKYDWAERVNSAAAWPGDTRPQRNCSYLYEFSTRICQTYDRSADTWDDTSGWAYSFLVEWYPDPLYPDTPTLVPWNDYDNLYDANLTTPSPSHMSLFNLTDNWFLGPTVAPSNTGIITWQEAKFSQLRNGDVCNSGLGSPGDPAYPAGWFNANQGSGLDPNSMINFGFSYPDGTYMYASAQHGYPASWLPIVRCFWHQTPAFVDNENYEEVLNLAVEGNTFYSAPGWEQTAWNYGRDGDMTEDQWLNMP